MLHAKSIAMSMAVACFFAVALIGSLSGLASWPCCERAIVAALVAYFATGAGVRAVNAILLQAIVDKQVNKERTGESQN